MNNWFSNLPKKSKIIILVFALLVIIGLWVMAWVTAVKAPSIDSVNTNTPVKADFIKTGTILFNVPELKQNTHYFIFEEPGSPALSKELITDNQSICATETGEAKCDQISASLELMYRDKLVEIEGFSQDNGSLLVKKITPSK